MIGFDISPRSAWRVWQRNLTVYSRTFHLNILPNFFEPVFYLLAMGMGLGARLGNGIDGIPYVAYITPGLAIYNAFMGASFEVTYNTFVKMNFARTYDSIIATPVSVEDVVLGEILWAITRGAIYSGAFLLIGALLGTVAPLAAIGIFLVSILAALLFASIGMVFTALIPQIDFYGFYYTLYVTPLLMFSGVFYPLEDLPKWVQKANWFTPLYHPVRVAKHLAHGGVGTDTWVSLAWTAIVGVAFLALALRLMKSRLVK